MRPSASLDDLQAQRPIRRLDELPLQVLKRVHRWELRELANHILRRMEQNPRSASPSMLVSL